MHKNAMKCNETLSKWCKNKHGASKIIDTLETYHAVLVKVTANMNLMLDAPFAVEEVKNALFEMYPTKALGPDGFPSHFFQ
jgi:hypothetical protein